MNFKAQTKIGEWSVRLIILMPLMFIIGTSLTDILYQEIPAGGTIVDDILKRPALALTMLLGMFCGISAFFSGLVSIIKYKEKSIFVYFSTLLGLILIIFLIGELFPH
jgi:hypothetical protein